MLKKHLLLCCLALPCLLLPAQLTSQSRLEPWGKDADLCHRESPCSKRLKKKQSGPLIATAECLILFHKNVISPADGPRSHYNPNSSQYALDAIRQYGFVVGFPMGCDRLMRENDDPWIYSTAPGRFGLRTKQDPVK